MLNHKLLVLVFLTFLNLLPAASFSQNASNTVSFSFNLKDDATTSAGVYNNEGTLIRTLWNNKKYSVGAHTEVWDGKDDDGLVVTENNYVIKVLSNNVNYKWEGVIGNTSDKLSGDNILKSLDFPQDMVIVGSTMYAAINYVETGRSPLLKLNADDPQHTIDVKVPRGQSEMVNLIASDGINMYCASTDAYAPSNRNKILTFVYAFKLSDETLINFEKGVAVDQFIGKDFSSTVSKMELNGNNSSNLYKGSITGIAVQRLSPYLFVSRGDSIQVIDKIRGTYIRSLFLPKVKKIKVDNSDNLWAISGQTIQKFQVNADGSLTKLLTISSGIQSPINIAVSPDNNTLVVADGGSSCQLKGYNISNGAPIWVFGKEGGYSKDATVADDKFFFSNQQGNVNAFIAFEPDGSLWVCDPENYRMQHYASNRTILNRVMFMGLVYSQFVNSTDPSRITANYLEFKIDYTKPLDNGKNGSWYLNKNWGYNIISGYGDQYEALRCITTLKNGRTYALMSIQNTKWEVIELVNGGNIRYTGVLINSMSHLYPDGSLRTATPFIAGQQSIFTKQDLTGFDASNNPIWTTPYIIARSPIATNKDPLYSGINHTTLTPGEITTSDKIVTFEGVKTANSQYGSSGYHLGAIRVGDDKWNWRTSKSTPNNYSGDMPTDGTFDIGNGVTYPGGSAKVLGNNIFWNYHGEGWKSGQTNIFNHFYENGLMVGQFGVLGQNGEGNAPGMAGNVFYPNVVKDPNDSNSAYIYHGDEGVHAATHRWKITGLNTIEIQEAILNNSSVTDTTEGIDLMQGLQHQSVLLDDTYGWKRFPKTQDVTSNLLKKYWSVTTGYKTYDNSKSADVFIEYNQKQEDYQVTRDLGTNENVASWKLWGNITWNGSQENQSDATGGSYFDVVDNNGKIIARVYRKIVFVPGGTVRYIYVNNIILAKDATWSIFNKTKVVNKLEISAVKGVLTFKYADYPAVTSPAFDPSADMMSPNYLNLSFYSRKEANFQHYRSMNISDFRFAVTADINTDLAGPAILADDSTNTLTATHPLGDYLIEVSENNGPFQQYISSIKVGNVARTKGYWKFRIGAAPNRKASQISESPEFTYTNITPDAPIILSDDTTKTISATHTLGISEILFSENNGAYKQYTEPIDEGNIARPAGYWKFKIKAAIGRNESAVAESAPFTFTPDAPKIITDDGANTIKASSPLGISEILTSINDGPYLGGFTQIYVGDFTRPEGYYKFKIRSADQRSESAIIMSPPFTTTPNAPTIVADDDNNTLVASSSLGLSEILVSENNEEFKDYKPIEVGNVTRAVGYWKFKIKAADGRSESSIVNSPAFTNTSTPDAPTIVADDISNTIKASSPLGTSEILTSINGGPYYGGYTQIYVGNYSRPAGYYKFKIRSAYLRDESSITYSPAFTTTPNPPTLVADDDDNTLKASSSLGTPEILVSENGDEFKDYEPIDVGNVTRPAGYWKFKIKAADGRSESNVVNSPAFTNTTTPDAPTIIADDIANTIKASSPLGTSEILTSINGGPYLGGYSQIYVGNYSRPAGYYKFKIKSAYLREESSITYSPAFTTTPNPPTLVADDDDNTLIASSSLGTSEILVSEDNGEFKNYEAIEVGNVKRPVGYWKFKIRAANGRSESSLVYSPAFNYTSTPSAPILTVDDKANTIIATSPLGESEILTSFNNGPFLGGYTKIYVGDYNRPAGYYRFKIRSANLRNESAITYSPAFTGNSSARIASSQNSSVNKTSDTTSNKSVFTSDKNVSSGGFIDDQLDFTVQKLRSKEIEQKVKIFPNPLTGNLITVTMVGFEKGKYKLRLMDLQGNIIMSKEINQDAASSSHPFNIDKQLVSGIYLIEVIGKNKSVINKIIKR